MCSLHTEVAPDLSCAPCLSPKDDIKNARTTAQSRGTAPYKFTYTVKKAIQWGIGPRTLTALSSLVSRLLYGRNPKLLFNLSLIKRNCENFGVCKLFIHLRPSPSGTDGRENKIEAFLKFPMKNLLYTSKQLKIRKVQESRCKVFVLLFYFSFIL